MRISDWSSDVCSSDLNVDDMRESPSVILMEKLRDAGAEVSYSDPHVPVFSETREHYFDLSSVELTRANIGEFDCLMLATDLYRFDYDLTAKASMVIDRDRKSVVSGKRVTVSVK